MIHTVHERTLRVLLGDDLFQHNKDICSHHKNVQSLIIGMLKKKELASPIMDSMFERKNEPDNILNFQEFLTESKRTVHYGLERLSCRSPQLWSLLPENIMEVESLEIFKREIKKWSCDDCPCRLCKPCLQNIIFL